MIHLRSLHLVERENPPQSYPYTLPMLEHFEDIQFSSEVTFFVGENGSGKSTLLESIAVSANSITVGSITLENDKSLQSIQTFAKDLKLIWNQKTHKGFFLRAEDFFGYTRRLALTKEEIARDIKTVEEEYRNRPSSAAALAKSPHQRDLNELNQRYGDRLEAASHGESFLNFFQTRFVANGLYLLDEPEAALSPISQLAFITILKQMVSDNAQFIIATHSPILMAFPGAVIWNFDSTPLAQINYDQVKHVEIMKTFLENPGSFLRYL